MSVPSTTIARRRRVLVAVAAALGLAELADAPTISFWEGAAVFGLLYLAGAWWTRRGGIGGPILIAALSLFEIQDFFGWSRGGVADWTIQVAFLAGSIVALAVALALLRAAHGARVGRARPASVDV
jgi:hypothetical protein